MPSTQSSQSPSINADPSLTRQVQTSAPAHDPKGYDGPPKVDPGDSGAKVGGNIDLSAVTGALEDQIAGEARVGYRGHNPDPTPNEAYTVAGVLGLLPDTAPAESEAAPAQTAQEPAAGIEA